MLTSPSPSRTCLGKTLLYQLLIVWAFLDTLAQTLGGGGRGVAFLSLGTVVNCSHSPGSSSHNRGLPSGQTARGLGLPSRGTAAPPQRPAWGRLWSSTQFLLQDIGS